MTVAAFDVVGDEVFFDGVKFATIDPAIWPSLRSEAVALIERAHEARPKTITRQSGMESQLTGMTSDSTGDKAFEKQPTTCN